MKFNWKANWEVVLVIVITVVIVIFTLATIRNKDKQLLALPEETDFGQLLTQNTNSNGLAGLSSPDQPTQQLGASDLGSDLAGGAVNNINNNNNQASFSSLDSDIASSRKPLGSNQSTIKNSRASTNQQANHNNNAAAGAGLARGGSSLDSNGSGQRGQTSMNNIRNYNHNFNRNNNQHNHLRQAYDDSAEYNRLPQTLIDTNNQLGGVSTSTSGIGTTSSLSMEANYDASSTEPTASQYINNNNNNHNLHHNNHHHDHNHHNHHHHQQHQNQIHSLNNNNNNNRLYAGSKRHTNRTSLDDFNNNSLNPTSSSSSSASLSSSSSTASDNQLLNAADQISDLIDDIHTTKSSLANNNNNLAGSSSSEFSSGSPQSDSITQSLALHGPYGITPPTMSQFLQHKQQQLNTEPTPTSSDIEETMMTSYSRVPTGSSTNIIRGSGNNNNITEALLREYVSTISPMNTNGNNNNNNNNNTSQHSSQLIGSAMLANLIASMPQSLANNAGEQLQTVAMPTNEPQFQQQTGSGSYRGGSSYPSSLPLSALLSDLIKLARPHQLINSLSGQNNNNNNNNQQERENSNRQQHSILQQLRSLPGPLLNLLQNLNPASASSSSSGNSNDFHNNNQLINHDASESSQHYHRISMSPTDIHAILTRSLRSTGVLPAFPPPKGAPQTWIPPTSGGNPSYHNALNSNADFVANNAAGFIRNSATPGSSPSPSNQHHQQQASIGPNMAATNEQQLNNNGEAYQHNRTPPPSSLYNPASGDVYQQQAQNDLFTVNNNNLYNNNQLPQSQMDPTIRNNWPLNNNNNMNMLNPEPVVPNINGRYSSAPMSPQQQLLNGNYPPNNIDNNVNQNSQPPTYNSKPISDNMPVPLGYQPAPGGVGQIQQHLPQQQRTPFEYNIAQVESSPKATVSASSVNLQSGKQQVGPNSLPAIRPNLQPAASNSNQGKNVVLRRRKRSVEAEPTREDGVFLIKGEGLIKNEKVDGKKNHSQANENVARIDEDMSGKYNVNDDEDEDDTDSRPISVVSTDGRPMNSGRISGSTLAQHLKEFKNVNDKNDMLIDDGSSDRQVAQSLRSANHLELISNRRPEGAAYSNDDYERLSHKRRRNNNSNRKRYKTDGSSLETIDDNNNKEDYDRNPNSAKNTNANNNNKLYSKSDRTSLKRKQKAKSSNEIDFRLMKTNHNKMEQPEQPGGAGLETAGSGLMSRLLGTASTNDELEDDMDDDEDSASEKRKEELDDAEFGLNNLNDERQKINNDNNHIESSRNNNNKLQSQDSRSGSQNTQENNNNQNNDNGREQPEAAQYNSQRRHHQQQRSDIEFYGHPGEETRQLKYGILGSGNYEVVNGGIYPEADESTAAVNSVANYVRKPGGLLANFPKLLAEHGGQVGGNDNGSPVGAGTPFMPGGRLGGGFMRGASAANHHQEELIAGLLPATIESHLANHHHSNNPLVSSPLLEFVEANGATQLLDANMLAQLGSSGSSARTTHASRDLDQDFSGAHTGRQHSDDDDEESNIANTMKKNSQSGKRLKMNQSKKINLNDNDNDDDDDETSKKKSLNSSNKMKGGDRSKSNIYKPTMQIKDSTITTTTTLGNNKSQGNNQFNSYQILPSKKVTIFSDQDLDSAPDEQHPNSVWMIPISAS